MILKNTLLVCLLLILNNVYQSQQAYCSGKVIRAIINEIIFYLIVYFLI